MQRATAAVLQELLDEMNRIVRDYHPRVERTGTTVSELIAGTAMFPGGAGLWRSEVPFGPLPKFFPENPVMFIGHNFDSIRSYEDSKRRGGEVNSNFWKILRGYLDAAELRPEQCFFTNVLMGIKPGSALGQMPSVPGYEEECRIFLLRQIEIVSPCALIALGNNADSQLKKASPALPWIRVRHPSAREYASLSLRHERVQRMGQAIQTSLLGWGVRDLLSATPLE